MKTTFNNLDNKTKGIIMVLIASLGFAFMTIFIKLAGDIPSTQKVLFRNLFSAIITFVVITKNKGSYVGKRENRKLLLLRSSFGTIGMVLYFYSVQNLVSSDANALNKLSTFFLLLFSFIFLKEKVSFNKIIAVIIAFTGALFIIKPSFNIDPAYFTSILGATAAGAAYTVLRALGKKEEFYTIVFFFSLFSTLVLTPFVVFNYVPMTLSQFGFLVLTGIFATVGQFGTTLAYKFAPASEVSIFNFANVIFVTLLAIPFLQEFPDIYSLLGYIIIFIASFYMFKTKK